jgi:hypothetical protein
MTISVLIEPVDGAGFRATGGEPFALTAEGATREGALARLRELIEARMAAGAEVVPLDLAAPDHPWAPLAGWLEGSPLLDEWQEAMAEYRRSIDEDDANL